MVKDYLDYCETSWGRFRTFTIYNNIRSALTPKMNCKSFLDIGCGPAHITQYLSPHFASGVAIDTSEDMICAVSHRCSNIIYQISSFEKFSSKVKFDLILCHNVLEYQNERMTFLSKISSLLRDQNSLLSLVFINRSKEIIELTKNGFFSEAKKLNDKGLYHSRTFGKTFYLPSVSELEEFVLECGFQIIVKRGIGVLSPNEYDKIGLEKIAPWEMKLQNDSDMIPCSTLIHFICNKNIT